MTPNRPGRFRQVVDMNAENQLVRATIEDPVVIQRILRHLGLSVEAGEALPTTRGSYSRTAASVSLPAASAKGNSRPTAKRPGPAITMGSNAAMASR